THQSPGVICRVVARQSLAEQADRAQTVQCLVRQHVSAASTAVLGALGRSSRALIGLSYPWEKKKTACVTERASAVTQRRHQVSDFLIDAGRIIGRTA